MNQDQNIGPVVDGNQSAQGVVGRLQGEGSHLAKCPEPQQEQRFPTSTPKILKQQKIQGFGRGMIHTGKGIRPSTV